ncbi:methyl-accepting chemotaxis protein [Paraburkholderia sp. HP33-1]|uniref:methyl-accepting chemotaxis protein n=1 Tax=Paraburkholderia sp. HP33-1 TaxID=2883243 RepID=UPI001F42BA0F|nr:methyl-accepting chemotaxis protein [Paraburkholderia sp. HP33-1]
MNGSTFSLKQRLITAWCSLGLLSIFVAILGIRGLADANMRAQRSYELITRPGQYIENSFIMTLGQSVQLMEVLGSTDEAARQQRLQIIQELRKGSDEQFDRFQRGEKADAIKSIAENLVMERQRFVTALSKVERLIRAGKAQDAIATEADEARPAGVALFQDVVRLGGVLDVEARAVHDRDVVAYRHILTLMIALLVTGGLVVGGYAWMQLRTIRRSVSGIQTTLHKAYQTLDLTHRAPVERLDELGQTANAFNQLMARVSAVLCAVRNSAESVTIASMEIASGNADLSARTETQAASLEETAASIQELTGIARRNTENAKRAAGLAVDASETAGRGNAVVAQVVGVMRQVSEGSAKIAEITGMIESVAFQTNILALNAAVEAARAGQQGRGFAVVATEVRALAQRAAMAAKEIKELIDAAVSVSAQGHELANRTGTAMTDIIGAVTSVTDIMAEIASASDEQNRSIMQVGQAVTQMDEVTQQKAALVEQTAAAARSMEEQAGRLKNSINEFTLETASR